jgi:hypothetical protein
MPDQLQLRGGTTVEHSTFIGASKEVTVDTTKKTVVVHDGTTTGGIPVMREDASNSALGLGSAGTPSIKFTGDLDTGIYSPGANQVAVATNGTGRLFVDASGNVGINKTPGFSLDVKGGYQTTAARFLRSADYGEVIRIGRDSVSETVSFNYPANGVLAIHTAGSERLRITDTGLVGVGTSSPISALHVIGEVVAGYSGATKFISLYPGNASQSPAIGFSSADSLRFVGASEYARIDSSGRLLVGTSSTTGNVRAVFSGWGTNPTQQGIVRIQRGSLPTSGQTIADVEFADDSNNLGAGLTAVAEANWVSGTSHPSRLVFSTTADGAASPTERLRITSGGLVGIGTSAPGELLQLRGSGATKLLISSADNSVDRGIYFGTSDNTVLGYIKQDYNTGKFEISSGSGTYSSGISFRTGGVSDRVVIDSSGRVGIGTTGPQEKLEIQDGSISVGSSANTSQVNTLIAGYGYILSGTKYGNTSIRSTYNNANNLSSLEFYTSSSATASTERARIDSSGRLLVGTSTANTSGAKLQTSDGITFPATQVASADPNTLDDYEEGTCLPSTGTWTNGGSTYTKIGRMVYIEIRGEVATTPQAIALPFAFGDTCIGGTALDTTTFITILSGVNASAAGGTITLPVGFNKGFLSYRAA